MDPRPAAGPLDRLSGTILSVWAHPDDETYLAAGLMAAAARAGQRVVCVTATRGELGSTDPERWPPGAALAAVRTEELAGALAVLGVTEHHWLDYPDGGCAAVPEQEAVDRLRALLADVEPDHVLTFGPDGQTGHSDHIAVGRWVELAVDSLADQPRPRVLQARSSTEWLAAYRPLLDPLGVFMGFEPWSSPRAELAVVVELEGDLLAAKLQAVLAQVSQSGPILEALGLDVVREILREESFADRDQ